MDEKNTCDGRRADRSCLDYQGVNDFQDTNSVICVHDLKTYGVLLRRCKTRRGCIQLLGNRSPEQFEVEFALNTVA